MPSNSVSFSDIIFSLGSWRIKVIKLLDFTLGGCLAAVLRGKRSASEPPSQPRSMLVIRPGGIGDAVFLLPLLKKIQETRPGLVVDILCEKRNVQVFRSQMHLCRTVFCYDIPTDLRGLRRAGRYDIIVDTEQWHYLSAATAYFLRGQYTTGFATRPLREKFFDRPIAYKANAYELENFKALFAFLLGDCQDFQDIRLSYSVRPSLLSWAEEKVSSDKTAALFIGASITPRRLTKGQCVESIRSLFSKGYSVVLLGGGDVVGAGREVEEEIKDPRLLNFVGQASLEETAALIQRARVFIGPDSGIMHLACAVGTPVIAIFGPGNLPKWGPKGERDRVVTLNVACSPCTRFGYTVPTCHGTYKCMREIQSGDIIK